MKLAYLALTLGIFPATAAHADTTYTSAAAFDAAAGTLTTVTFDGQAPANSFISPANPFTESGTSFSYSGEAFIISPGYYGSSYAGGDFFTVDYGADTITVTLPSSEGVSFNYGGLLGGPVTVGVALSDGFTTTFSTNDSIEGSGTLDFAGITSSTPFTSITFSLPDFPDYGALDNIAFTATTSATPEPSTLALLSTGLAGLGGMIRRKLRS